MDFKLPAYPSIQTGIRRVDPCILGGFPYGYGGMKYAVDNALVARGKLVRSMPNFQ